jgi:Flp pilus assembly protein TadG
MRILGLKTDRFFTNNRPVAGAKTRNFRRQSGQALIEMAFVVPLLLLLVLGVIEIGRYAYIAILVGNAARAGADYGAQSSAQSVDTTGIQNAAYYDFAGGTTSSSSANGLSRSTLTVTSVVACGCDSGGAITSAGCTTGVNPTAGACTTGNWIVFVSVTASGTFNALFSYPGIPTSITISRTATIPVASV